MKARKHSNYTSMTEARREVSRESENVQEKIFRQAVDDMYVQLIATVFWTMATRYGWGKVRLRGLLETLKDTKDLMDKPSPLHHRFDGLDCEQIIKDKYGIDLAKELPPQVEVKP